MMHNDSKAILEDLLSRWHHHCKHFSPVPVSGADPMFRDSRTPNHWDTAGEITDATVNSNQMKAVDFHVGEMEDPYRAAIHVLARNCYTGRSVWISPRLPQDIEQRAVIVEHARAILQNRLMRAGVM